MIADVQHTLHRGLASNDGVAENGFYDQQESFGGLMAWCPCHTSVFRAFCKGWELPLQTHVDNSFGNSLAFTMNNTYGERSAETHLRFRHRWGLPFMTELHCRLRETTPMLAAGNVLWQHASSTTVEKTVQATVPRGIQTQAKPQVPTCYWRHAAWSPASDESSTSPQTKSTVKPAWELPRVPHPSAIPCHF